LLRVNDAVETLVSSSADREKPGYAWQFQLNAINA